MEIIKDRLDYYGFDRKYIGFNILVCAIHYFLKYDDTSGMIKFLNESTHRTNVRALLHSVINGSDTIFKGETLQSTILKICIIEGWL